MWRSRYTINNHTTLNSSQLQYVNQNSTSPQNFLPKLPATYSIGFPNTSATCDTNAARTKKWTPRADTTSSTEKLQKHTTRLKNEPRKPEISTPGSKCLRDFLNFVPPAYSSLTTDLTRERRRTPGQAKLRLHYRKNVGSNGSLEMREPDGER